MNKNLRLASQKFRKDLCGQLGLHSHAQRCQYMFIPLDQLECTQLRSKIDIL